MTATKTHKGSTTAVTRNLFKFVDGNWAKGEVWEKLPLVDVDSFTHAAKRYLGDHSNLRTITLDRADWDEIYQKLVSEKTERTGTLWEAKPQTSAATQEEKREAALAEAFAERDAKPEIPQPTPVADHAQCGHGINDLIGYVVTFTTLDKTTGIVTYSDVEYVQGAENYDDALKLVRTCREMITQNLVDATYAVIHHVYKGAHRMQ